MTHETIGHLAEADVYKNRKSPQLSLGKQICNSSINIVDYANTIENNFIPAPVF